MSSQYGCTTIGTRAPLRLVVARYLADQERPRKQRRAHGGIRTAYAEYAAVDVDYTKEGKKRLSFEEPGYDKKQEATETAGYQGGFEWGGYLEDSADEVFILC